MKAQCLTIFALLACFALPTAAASAAAAEPERAMAPSDPEAVRVAKRVLKALGGRDAWESTRYIAWNFFGMRFHVWDRWTCDLRTDAIQGVTVLMNLQTGRGRVVREGVDFEGEELERALLQARSTWINDSYWVAMPYKLLDPGVRLRGPRDRLLPDGSTALSLRLSFDEVGRTHWNAYEVFVDPDTHLVRGWAFYRNASNPEPDFELPWTFDRRGRVLLPVDHGREGPWSIEVFDELPPSVLTELEPRLDMDGLLAIATPAPRQEPGR